MVDQSADVAKQVENVVEGGLNGKLVGSLDGLTTAEKNVVDKLIGNGNTIEIIPRSNINGVKTPDFLINGVRTELKTLTGTSMNTPVTRIQEAFKQGAEAVIIDGTGVGLTAEQAQTIITRATGVYKGQLPGNVQIWTVDGIIGGVK